MTRNSQMQKFQGSNWNLVFSGCLGAPATHCGNQGGAPYTTLWKTDRIVEKPYIVSKNGKFNLMIPRFEQNKQGATKDWNNADEVDFADVFVANETSTAEEISLMLQNGLRIVFQPGIYNLTESIYVDNDGAVLLGLGMATLVSTTGKPVIEVGNIDNVRIAGLILQAGPVKAEYLLRWGTYNSEGDLNNPGVMSDVYVRVGGPEHQKVTPTSVGTMIIIYRPATIIDNTWLWRADHDVDGAVTDLRNPSDTGLIVYGDNVTAYGLMSEHHLKNLVEWHGDYGKTVMYQSEFPYDADTDYANKSYVSYWVSPNVTHHKGYGVGAYAFFRDHPTLVENGIMVPETEGIRMINSLSVFLWGNKDSGINHVINGKGRKVGMSTDHVTWVCDQDPELYWGEGSNALSAQNTTQEDKTKPVARLSTITPILDTTQEVFLQ